MRLLKLLLLSLPLPVALGGCLDGFETDKVSSEVEIEPSLLLPLITSNVSVKYLFGEIDNAVEYYVADDEDGSNRIRFKAAHDSIVSLSVVDLLGVSDGMSYRASLDLASVSPAVLSAAGAPGGSAASYTVDLPVDLGEGVTVYSFGTSFRVSCSWSGFSAPMSLTMTVGGQSRTVDVGGDGLASGAVSVDFGNLTLAPTDEKIGVSLLCAVAGETDGQWGSLDFGFKLDDVDAVQCSLKQFAAEVPPVIQLTHLGEFEKTSRYVIFEEPRLWLSCDNSTAVNLSLRPKVSTAISGGKSLGDAELNVGGRCVAEHEYNKDNSTIREMLSPVPDTLVYSASLSMSMPVGVERVTLSRADSLFMGFRYEVPFDFMIDADLSENYFSVSDIPEHDRIVGAQLIVTSTNGLPLDISLVATLIEDDDARLSVIDMPRAVETPSLSEWGTVAGEARHEFKVFELSDENIADLRRARKIGFVTVASSGGRFVAPKLEDELSLDVALAVKLEFKN